MIFSIQTQRRLLCVWGCHIQGIHLWNQSQEAKIIQHKACSSVSNGINDVVVGAGDQEALVKAEL